MRHQRPHQRRVGACFCGRCQDPRCPSRCQGRPRPHAHRATPSPSARISCGRRPDPFAWRRHVDCGADRFGAPLAHRCAPRAFRARCDPETSRSPETPAYARDAYQERPKNSVTPHTGSPAAHDSTCRPRSARAPGQRCTPYAPLHDLIPARADSRVEHVRDPRPGDRAGGDVRRTRYSLFWMSSTIRHRRPAGQAARSAGVRRLVFLYSQSWHDHYGK